MVVIINKITKKEPKITVAASCISHHKAKEKITMSENNTKIEMSVISSIIKNINLLLLEAI